MILRKFYSLYILKDGFDVENDFDVVIGFDVPFPLNKGKMVFILVPKVKQIIVSP